LLAALPVETISGRGADDNALALSRRLVMYYIDVIHKAPMTITIRLPTKLEAKLRARLDRRGTGLSDFVRDAITEKLERELVENPSAYDLGKDLFGKHASGRDDLSTNRKTIVNEMLRGKYRR
jgi:RHH-type transcriptional regulator, rel operon repressor / antitoxin RelB